MKDSELRRILQASTPEPDYAKKDYFIREIRKSNSSSEMSFVDVLRIQARFIRKRIWLLSILIIALAYVLVSMAGDDVRELLPDLMPLIAGLGMLEVVKADYYKMAELEKVTRISARASLFAKMTVIGLIHLITLAFIVFISLGGVSGIAFTFAGFLVPYLMTTSICMEVERRNIGRDNAWYCLVVPILVITLRELILNYEIFKGLTAVTPLLALILICVQAYEINKTAKLEDCVWN